MLDWEFIHPKCNYEMLGMIPMVFWENDPRPAKDQINDRYRHGGGWNPIDNITMDGDSFCYPGDPPYQPLAKAKLHDETLIYYRYSFVAIVQSDGSFEVGRMD